MIQGRSGNGQGRCAVVARMSLISALSTCFPHLPQKTCSLSNSAVALRIVLDDSQMQQAESDPRLTNNMATAEQNILHTPSDVETRNPKLETAPTVNVFAVHGVEPEVQAYAMAKYSRSALSMKESLKEISEQKAE